MRIVSGRILLVLVLVLMSTAPGRAQIFSVTTIPPETVKTRTVYDPARRTLTLSCEVAGRGACRFVVVDGATRRQVLVRARARSVVADVSDQARVCLMGRNPGVTCNLQPVSG